MDGDFGALQGEAFGDGEAYALGRAGDEGFFAFEIKHGSEFLSESQIFTKFPGVIRAGGIDKMAWMLYNLITAITNIFGGVI